MAESKRAKVPADVKRVVLDGNSLTVNQVVLVARSRSGSEVRVEIDAAAAEVVEKCSRAVHEIGQRAEAKYGINTGFGCFHNRVLDKDEIEILNRNLITSHAITVGVELAPAVVRAAMLIRVNTLARGNSGVRLTTLQTLVDMLNKGVTPVVRSQGSLASSGDLAPLAHIALVLSEPVEKRDVDGGSAYYYDERSDASVRFEDGAGAMRAAGISRVRLTTKEGLALINGSTVTAALACLNVDRAERIWTAANFAYAVSMEALCGVPSALAHEIHAARRHEGQVETARHMRALLEKSSFVGSQADRVQDAYSLRVAPQVHGAVWSNVVQIRATVENEINASTDNPLLFCTENEGKEVWRVLSGGNFHGECLGFAMEQLKLVVSELAAISERRLARLIDGKQSNGLPDMLVDPKEKPGLQSGLMISQYTAASLTLENAAATFPPTALSLPTSAGQEDHNSNAMTAARGAVRILDNAFVVIALEVHAAARGIHIRTQTAKTEGAEEKKALVSGPAVGLGVSRLLSSCTEMTKYVPVDYSVRRDVDGLVRFLDSAEFSEVYQSVVKTYASRVETDRRQTRKLAVPSGMRDLNPEQMRLREGIFQEFRRIYKLFGVEEIDTPALERRDVIFGKYGEQEKLVFNLDDQGGAPLTLRYDLTVPFARYMAMTGRKSMKRFHIGKVYRRDNPSIATGRFREFYQMDVDFAGAADLMVPDAEIISVMKRCFDAVLLPAGIDFQIKVNHRKLLDCMIRIAGLPVGQFASICSSIDKLDKVSWVDVEKELVGTKKFPPDAVERLGRMVCLRGDAKEVLPKLGEMFVSNPEVAPVLKEMELLAMYLEWNGSISKVQVDTSLARGLGYYTGVIFEAVAFAKAPEEKKGAQRAAAAAAAAAISNVGSIGGGGRYDELIGMFSGDGSSIPSVGMAIGIERILTVVEEAKKRDKTQDASEIKAYVCAIDPKTTMRYAMEVAKNMRDAGIAVEFPTTTHNITMKAAIGHCVNRNIGAMLIVGETEMKSRQVTLKTITSAPGRPTTCDSRSDPGCGSAGESAARRPQQRTVDLAEAIKILASA